MLRSGFVLAGGRSFRMGQDKALLQFQGATMISHVARAVREAAGSVVLVGNPERYGFLGYPVIRDRLPNRGPLGGIYTALRASTTDWNLVVACDMPGISAPVLTALLDRAAQSSRRCVTATGNNGEPEPLCAVYHRGCLPALAGALRDKRFKMKDLVRELDAEAQVVEPGALANVNTPAEWKEFEEG
jgi:molybdopterin-guanine dinucleotide biosynthesis protein A